MEKCRYNGGTYIQASFKSHLTSGVYMDPNCQFEATSSPCWGLYEAKCLGVSPGCPGGEKYKFKGFAFFSYVCRPSCSNFTFCTASKYFHRRGNDLDWIGFSNFQDIISIFQIQYCHSNLRLVCRLIQRDLIVCSPAHHWNTPHHWTPSTRPAMFASLILGSHTSQANLHIYV